MPFSGGKNPTFFLSMLYAVNAAILPKTAPHRGWRWRRNKPKKRRLRQNRKEPYLVGGFNPFEKYLSNWIISPSKGEHKKCLKPSPSYFIFLNLGNKMFYFGRVNFPSFPQKVLKLIFGSVLGPTVGNITCASWVSWPVIQWVTLKTGTCGGNLLDKSPFLPWKRLYPIPRVLLGSKLSSQHEIQNFKY